LIDNVQKEISFEIPSFKDRHDLRMNYPAQSSGVLKIPVLLPISWEKVVKDSRVQGFKCLFFNVLSVSKRDLSTKTNLFFITLSTAFLDDTRLKITFFTLTVLYFIYRQYIHTWHNIMLSSLILL
jgi:hypothetical protein